MTVIKPLHPNQPQMTVTPTTKIMGWQWHTKGWGAGDRDGDGGIAGGKEDKQPKETLRMSLGPYVSVFFSFCCDLLHFA
jgi:hypothetical protein